MNNGLKKRASERIEYLCEQVERPLIDLSTTGLCCFSRTKKEKGATVQVKLNDLDVGAKVVYCQQRGEGYRLGVQFSEVDGDIPGRINDLVEKYSRGVPVECRLD